MKWESVHTHNCPQGMCRNGCRCCVCAWNCSDTSQLLSACSLSSRLFLCVLWLQEIAEVDQLVQTSAESIAAAIPFQLSYTQPPDQSTLIHLKLLSHHKILWLNKEPSSKFFHYWLNYVFAHQFSYGVLHAVSIGTHLADKHWAVIRLHG